MNRLTKTNSFTHKYIRPHSSTSRKSPVEIISSKEILKYKSGKEEVQFDLIIQVQGIPIVTVLIKTKYVNNCI